MAHVIKQIKRQGDSTEYLIGSNSKLIETFNGIDLESLFKIGESCWTTTDTTSQTQSKTVKKFGNSIVFYEDPSHNPRIQINYPYYELDIVNVLKDDIQIRVSGTEDDPNVLATGTQDSDDIIVDRALVQRDYDYTYQILKWISSSIDEKEIARKDIYTLQNDTIEIITVLTE